MTTPPLELDWKRFVDDVRALAAESPDFVYTRGESIQSECSYEPTASNPQGCLIGAALARQGVDTMDLVGPAVSVLLGLGALAPVRHWAQSVQRAQDIGQTWSESVENAGRVEDQRRGVWS